jgi:hypothetical protein
VAVYRPTGMLTMPKVMTPFHIALAISAPVVGWRVAVSCSTALLCGYDT